MGPVLRASDMGLDEQLVMQACVKGKAGDLDALLNRGAPLRCEDEEGRSPLHVAAWLAKACCVAVLLRHGANADVEDSCGDTPIWIATRRNSPEIVQMLLDYGCGANAIHPRSGHTLLDVAVETDSEGTGVIATLLRAGADPRMKNADGSTAYSHARALRSRAFAQVADATVEALLRREP